jgi:hypothetical protein
VVGYRGMGLPDDYLPSMIDMRKTCWIWCDLSHGGSAIAIPKGTREFSAAEKEWTVLAPSFNKFIDGMQLELSPLLAAFRIAGTGNVQPSMRKWFVDVLGEDWENRIQELIREKRRSDV